jgi:hypothetical protein
MVKSDEQPKVMENIEPKESYQTALNTRNFEISLFWQRSNYFLVLNSALALGFFNLQNREYAIFLAAFGFFVSCLWFRVNLGSKFWQLRWEQRLSEIENKINPDLDFFAVDLDTVRTDVENSIKNDEHKGWFRRCLDRQVLKKHSVSYNMTLLSISFMVAWAILAILFILRVLRGRPLLN